MSNPENRAAMRAPHAAATRRPNTILPHASALALACSAALAFPALAQQAQPADAGKAPAQETAKTLDKVEVVGIREDIYVTNTLFRLDRRTGFGFLREAVNPAGDKLRRDGDLTLN